jgi:adenylosuccinate lyase
VNALSAAEGDVETSLATAEAALGLAPNTVLGGTMQAVSSAIPWTDAKALANLTQSLNSDKVLAVLQQLKNQSRTGATGFGALSEKELDLILAKTRALDPTDKMFKENLTIVMNGWKKVKESLSRERKALQGKTATKRFNPATGKIEEVQ